MSVIEVRIPDIGDFQNVEIIEILVKPGFCCGRDQYDHT